MRNVAEFRWVIFLIVFICSGFGLDDVYAERFPNSISELLEDMGEESDCDSLVGYEEGDWPGYAPGEPEESYVFWCKKRNPKPKEGKYLLLFWFEDPKNELAQCPAKLDWYEMEYLRVFPPEGKGWLNKQLKIKKWTLDRFKYLKVQKSGSYTKSGVHGPKKQLIHNGIELSDEGQAAILYCHERKWLLYEATWEYID